MTRFKVIRPFSVVYVWANNYAHASKLYPDNLDIEEL